MATGLLVGAALIAATAAVAASSDSSFTGCLTRGGVLINLAEGDSPLRPCRGHQEQVSLSSAAAVGALQADIDALLGVIQIDPVTGAVTIASSDKLVLDAGAGQMVMIMDDTEIEGDAMLMEDATVMGETELEGNAMLMQDADVMGELTVESAAMLMDDATVMGETMLEGDAMLMQEAEVMGDALFEATVSFADSNAIVSADGVLTPASSSVTVTAFDGSFVLESITPAAVDGTILDVHFGVSGIIQERIVVDTGIGQEIFLVQVENSGPTGESFEAALRCLSI